MYSTVQHLISLQVKIELLRVVSVEHNQSKLNKCFDGNIPSEAQHVFDSTQIFSSGIGYCYTCQKQHAATGEVHILLLGNTSVDVRVPYDDNMSGVVSTIYCTVQGLLLR